MDAGQVDYKEFRRKLDDVLRQRDPAVLRAFLIEQGQWTVSQQTDTEAAMWMMIGTSPALREMHAEAERWLLTHGHEVEAQAIFGGGRAGSAGSAGGRGGKGRATPRSGGGGSGGSGGNRGTPPGRRARNPGGPARPTRDRQNGHHGPRGPHPPTSR